MPLRGVGVKVIHKNDEVRVLAGVGPLEPPRVLDGCVDEVVLPLEGELGGLLEDGLLLHSIVANVILDFAGRGTGAESYTIRESRLY